MSKYGPRRSIKTDGNPKNYTAKSIALMISTAALGGRIARFSSSYLSGTIAFIVVILSSVVCIGIVAYNIFLINKYCPHLKKEKY